MQEQPSATLFALTYLVILAIHFFYALYCIHTKIVDLTLGPVKRPSLILASLLALNGVSLLAFVFTSAASVLAHVGLHAILAIDETIRTRRAPQRWVFLVNHVLWVALLAVWFGKTNSI